jgi:hypothetical protein
MNDRIVILDYSFDWYLDERNVHPKPEPGPLSREDIVEFSGTLGVGSIELLHGYWGDCSTAYLKQITSDARLPIVTYIFAADLTQAPADRRSAVDHVYAMLDRTAELGATLAMVHPAFLKEEFPLGQQRGWLIDGLRQCAERAESVGLTLVAENIDDPPIRAFMGRGTECRDICAEVVKDETDDLGAEVVVDAVGSQFGATLELAAKQGKIALFGVNEAAQPPVRQYDITRNELTVIGTFVGENVFPRAIQILESGALKPSVMNSLLLPLEDIHRGIDAARRGEAVKVIVSTN